MRTKKGEPTLYCFIFLYFSAAGAGPWSMDAKRETHLHKRL